jgi:hypothetical protein
MLILQCVTTVVAILILIVAVLAHSVRFRLGAARFELCYDPTDIEIRDGRGWFHLYIIQKRRPHLEWLFFPLPATNCRVMLRRIAGATVDDSSWSPAPTPELQFQWPLAGNGGEPSFRNIAIDEHPKVDIGELSKAEGLFRPLLYQYEKKFGDRLSRDGAHWGCVVAGESVQYHIYFVCDQFVSQEYKFEVSWDGEFPHNRTELANHLTIREVK